MNDFADFLRGLLREGRVVFPCPPSTSGDQYEESIAVLEGAYRIASLDVAGPPIPFDPMVAIRAGELVRHACWALVNREERSEDLVRRLVLPHAPTSPAQHLSADLVFRFLPQIHRRARRLDPTDPLTLGLEKLLLRWPLSGVLSDIEEGPTSPTDFGGHPGLMMLYAERLALNERIAWRPEGRTLEYVELILVGLGRGRSHLLNAHGGGDG